MSTTHIDQARVVSDDGAQTVDLRRIGDEALGLDTWLVSYGAKNFPVEGYDKAAAEADALLGEVAKALPVLAAAKDAEAVLASFVDAKRVEHEAIIEQTVAVAEPVGEPFIAPKV